MAVTHPSTALTNTVPSSTDDVSGSAVVSGRTSSLQMPAPGLAEALSGAPTQSTAATSAMTQANVTPTTGFLDPERTLSARRGRYSIRFCPLVRLEGVQRVG
jgi:hypothetical protein